LEQVVSSVEAQYPLLLGAAKDVEAAQGEFTSSEGAFDLLWKNRVSSSALGFYDNQRFDSVLEKPLTIAGSSVFFGYRLGRGDFAVYDEKSLTLSQGEFRFGFELSLWRNRSIDRRRSNLEKSRLALTAAEASAVQARLDAVRSGSLRYWDWAAAGQRVVVFRGLLTTAEDRDRGLAERVRHGDLPEFERKDNERAILQRKSQLVSAERSLQQTAIELALFVRDPEGNPREPSEKELPAALPPPGPMALDLASDVKLALSQRPEFSRLAASREQMGVEADWADNQLLPRLDLQVAASRDIGSGSPTRAGTELEGSILLEIPLERRLARGRGDSARAMRDRTEAVERMTRDRVSAEVRDTHSALRAAKQRFEIALAESELARKLEQGERSRLDHGDSNILFVNLREQATADALVRELEALADYHKGIAQRLATIGELSVSSREASP